MPNCLLLWDSAEVYASTSLSVCLLDWVAHFWMFRVMLNFMIFFFLSANVRLLVFDRNVSGGFEPATSPPSSLKPPFPTDQPYISAQFYDVLFLCRLYFYQNHGFKVQSITILFFTSSFFTHSLILTAFVGSLVCILCGFKASPICFIN